MYLQKTKPTLITPCQPGQSSAPLSSQLRQMLGLSRQSLYVKLRKFGMVNKDEE
jgi:hypothetical protein